MKTRVNRFDVQVVFGDFTFSVKSRTDVTLTPEDVAKELEAIVARIRNDGLLPSSTDEAQAVSNQHEL